MRTFCTLCFMALLAIAPAWGAQDGPLPAAKPHPSAQALKPGRAAGTVKAQQIKSGIALVAAGGIIAVVGLVVGTSGGSGGGSAQTDRQSAPVATTP
jgi:hypothetical protein